MTAITIAAVIFARKFFIIVAVDAAIILSITSIITIVMSVTEKLTAKCKIIKYD